MDKSDDNQKRKNILNNPFERVNHSTNFEDYACTSDDTFSLYTRSQPKLTLNSQPITKGNKSSKLEPMAWNHMTDQRDHTSSAEVTPSGTPQSSPYTLRKVLENKKMVKNNDNKNVKNELSANQKRWFVTGFFSDMKNGLEDKAMPTIPKTQSFKNLCVSNFDINAVGPTSW